MFKLQTHRGFTLIELLVVIAIIGILAATVLASLGNARSSGSDASVISSVNSAKAQAELFYTGAGTYAGVCGPGTNTLTALLTAIAAASTGADSAATSTANQTSTTLYCNADQTRWVVSAPMINATGGQYFCADSTGFSGRRNTAITHAAYVCPSS